MKGQQANASAKSKEVQRHPQANTHLHTFSFAPTAQQTLLNQKDKR